jgi:trimeric autotransporter adhesin
MKSFAQFKTTILPLLSALVFGCIAVLPAAHALNPPPDGGYLGGNTAEGTQALNSLILLPGRGEVGGLRNTAIGYQTLFSDIVGSDNTATGYQALNNNTASFNSAFGGLALFGNTDGSHNSGVGWGALRENTTGNDNTAVGHNALTSNINGFGNTATGAEALVHNIHGTLNTAFGYRALYSNDHSGNNVAIGSEALYSNGSTFGGSNNTAIGYFALHSNTAGGGNNTAVGSSALSGNTTGNFNIALGESAGFLVTTGFLNIDIGHTGVTDDSHTIRIGADVEQNRTFIAGIYGTPITGGVPVVVNGNGQLGVAAIGSSWPSAPASRGLKRRLASYEAMNAKLRSEFLKEHCKVQQLTKDFESKFAEQQKQIQALTAGLQKVSAQLELSKSAPQTVLSKQ